MDEFANPDTFFGLFMTALVRAEERWYGRLRTVDENGEPLEGQPSEESK